MSLAGYQINRIVANFQLQKSLENFDTDSADKIQFQNYKGVKVPCLMSIRVKLLFFTEKKSKKFGWFLTQKIYFEVRFVIFWQGSKNAYNWVGWLIL